MPLGWAWGEEGDVLQQNLFQNCMSCLNADFSLPAIEWSQKFTAHRNVAEIFNPGLEIGNKQMKFSHSLLDWRI